MGVCLSLYVRPTEITEALTISQGLMVGSPEARKIAVYAQAHMCRRGSEPREAYGSDARAVPVGRHQGQQIGHPRQTKAAGRWGWGPAPRAAAPACRRRRSSSDNPAWTLQPRWTASSPSPLPLSPGVVRPPSPCCPLTSLPPPLPSDNLRVGGRRSQARKKLRKMRLGVLCPACCLSQRMHATSTHSLAQSSDLALRKVTRMREVFA